MIYIIKKMFNANGTFLDSYPELRGVSPIFNEINLPKYVSLVINREKPHLVFEKRVDGKRLGLKMVLPEEYDLEEQIEKLNEKIKEKYEGESVL